MRQMVINGPLQVGIKEKELKEPESDEIAVRTVLSGVSVGTEMAVYRGTINNLHNGRWGYWTEYPITAGYELVGNVEKTGKDIHDVSEGDRVVCLAPHGTRANVTRHSYVSVPENVTNEEATMAVLGATTTHGIRKAQVQYGDRILILGLGVVGFLSAFHARRFGAREVYVADPRSWKRSFAQKSGFRYVLDPQATDFEEEILDLTDGNGMDVVIEASGHPSAFPPALRALRKGGKLLVQGTHAEPVELNFSDYPMHREALMICTWSIGPTRDFDPESRIWSARQNLELSMELISRKELPVANLVTHRYRFEDLPEVYALLEQNKIDYLQVILDY